MLMMARRSHSVLALVRSIGGRGDRRRYTRHFGLQVDRKLGPQAAHNHARGDLALPATLAVHASFVEAGNPTSS